VCHERVTAGYQPGKNEGSALFANAGLEEEQRPRFVRVLPNDFGRVLATQKKMRETGMSEEEAEMAAFDLNSHDAARVGGQ
jgi:hypothetical protein